MLLTAILSRWGFHSSGIGGESAAQGANAEVASRRLRGLHYKVCDEQSARARYVAATIVSFDVDAPMTPMVSDASG